MRWMRVLITLGLLAGLVGCATSHEVRCDTKLTPINAERTVREAP